MADAVYEVKDGAIVRDGASWVPTDPTNVDYQRYLAESGKTDVQVKAEMKVLRVAAEAAATTERTKDRALRKSARDKLVALGLTRKELAALLNSDD